MTQDIWLNLPVKNLAASVAFFKAIGLVLNPGPGNTEVSASFVVGDKKVVLMLFTDTVFSGFTRNALSSSADGTEVLFSLGVESDNRWMTWQTEQGQRVGRYSESLRSLMTLCTGAAFAISMGIGGTFYTWTPPRYPGSSTHDESQRAGCASYRAAQQRD
jgi:predicted lactoylglutathione lyase